MFGNEVAMEVTGNAVELQGEYGCTMDFPTGCYLRDAKTLSLQKTSDDVTAVAGKMLLGIPMGPPPGAHCLCLHPWPSLVAAGGRAGVRRAGRIGRLAGGPASGGGELSFCSRRRSCMSYLELQQ